MVLCEKRNIEHIDNLLTGHEFDLIQQLLELLEPIFLITQSYSGSSYPSCSIITPSLEKFRDG